MDSFPINNSQPWADMISTIVDQTQSVKVQETKLASELQENSDREKEIDSLPRNKLKDQGNGDWLKSTRGYQIEANKAKNTEYGSKICDVESTVCSKEIKTIPKRELKPQEDASGEVEPTNIDPKESIKPQRTENILEGITDSEKERNTFLKHKLKLQGAESEVKSTSLDKIECVKPQGMGHGLELQFRTNRKKETVSLTQNKTKLQGSVPDGAKTDIAKQNNAETENKVIEKLVKDKSVDKNTHMLAARDAREKRVRYKEKHARIQVLTLGDSLEAYLPSLKTMILDRKYRHCDLICKLDKLKQCSPTNATYCKCVFLIDLDEQTGKPILGIFTNGKVQKNWEGRQLYHPNILEVAEVFEKLISASEWEVGRGNKGFWRKLQLCCNRSGELVVWLLVQSPEEKAKEVIQKLKTLFTEFFEKGEGRKCKIASVYAQVTFTYVHF